MSVLDLSERHSATFNCPPPFDAATLWHNIWLSLRNHFFLAMICMTMQGTKRVNALPRISTRKWLLSTSLCWNRWYFGYGAGSTGTLHMEGFEALGVLCAWRDTACETTNHGYSQRQLSWIWRLEKDSCYVHRNWHRLCPWPADSQWTPCPVATWMLANVAYGPAFK